MDKIEYFKILLFFKAMLKYTIESKRLFAPQATPLCGEIWSLKFEDGTLFDVNSSFIGALNVIISTRSFSSGSKFVEFLKSGCYSA